MQEQGQIDSSFMVEALFDKSDEVRMMAIKTCGVVRDKRFNEILLTLSGEEDLWNRVAALFALGETGDSSLAEDICVFGKSNNVNTAVAAIQASGKLGRECTPSVQVTQTEVEEFFNKWKCSAVPSGEMPLNEFYFTLAGEARYAYAYWLFKVAPETSVRLFQRLLSETDESQDDFYSEDTKAICARGLGDSKDTTAIKLAFDEFYEKVGKSGKIEFIRALGKNKIGRGRLGEYLQQTDDSGLRREFLAALGQLGNNRDFDLIAEYLEDPSLQVRMAAIASLPLTSKIRAVRELDEQADDSLWQIRAETARAYGALDTRNGEKRLKQMLTEKDERVKAAVIQALGEYPVPRNIDIFEAAMFGSNDPVVRQIACDILGNSKNQKALGLLLRMASEIDSTENIDFCRTLVSSLGYYVDTTETGHSAIAAIMPFLNHHNRIVRQDAYNALGDYAPAEFDPGKYEIVLDRKYFNFMMDLTRREVIAHINTSRGELSVLLKASSAPRTVANFVRLAERKFYDGLTFHRVVQDFVVQGGCPRGDGWGDPGYMIREEINPIRFKTGTIGMATSGRDTGGSQFFLCLSPQPHLDGRYTAFGELLDGLDVLNKIEIGDTIVSVTIEKGER